MLLFSGKSNNSRVADDEIVFPSLESSEDEDGVTTDDDQEPHFANDEQRDVMLNNFTNHDAAAKASRDQMYQAAPYIPYTNKYKRVVVGNDGIEEIDEIDVVYGGKDKDNPEVKHAHGDIELEEFT